MDPRHVAASPPVMRKREWLFSVTQLTTHMACPRQDHYLYVRKLRTPPNEGMRRGDFCHKRYERHLTTGEPIDLIVMPEARLARPFLYRHDHPGIRVERTIRFEVAGRPYTGKV